MYIFVSQLIYTFAVLL